MPVPFPIEYMDKSKCFGKAGGTLSAALNILQSYGNRQPLYNEYSLHRIQIWNGSSYDRSAAVRAQMALDNLLMHYKRPVIAKVRYMHGREVQEHYVVITGMSAPGGYYTYADLFVTNESFRDQACDTESNRFEPDGTDIPLLVDSKGINSSGAYTVSELVYGEPLQGLPFDE